MKLEEGLDYRVTLKDGKRHIVRNILQTERLYVVNNHTGGFVIVKNEILAYKPRKYFPGQTEKGFI